MNGARRDFSVAPELFELILGVIERLAQVRRVVKPDGVVILLEHVRPDNPALGWLADFMTPFRRKLFGPEMNRRTEETVAEAGLDVVEVRREAIWREIVCRRSPADRGTERT